MNEMIRSEVFKNVAQLVHKAPPAEKMAALGAATLGMCIYYAGKHYLPKIAFLG